MKKMTDKRKKEILKLINDLHFEFGTKNPIRLCNGLGIDVVSANIEMKGLYTEVFSSKLIIIQNLLDDFARLFVVVMSYFMLLNMIVSRSDFLENILVLKLISMRRKQTSLPLNF